MTPKINQACLYKISSCQSCLQITSPSPYVEETLRSQWASGKFRLAVFSKTRCGSYMVQRPQRPLTETGAWNLAKRIQLLTRYLLSLGSIRTGSWAFLKHQKIYRDGGLFTTDVYGIFCLLFSGSLSNAIKTSAVRTPFNAHGQLVVMCFLVNTSRQWAPWRC